MSERDGVLEEAARFIERHSITDIRGIMAKRKRDREDANLCAEARRELRAEMARDVRALKTMRGTDAVEVLRELSELNPNGRHDVHLRDAWPLAWKGWLNISATISTNCNSIPPETKYQIVLTDRGREVLASTPSPALRSGGDR